MNNSSHTVNNASDTRSDHKIDKQVVNQRVHKISKPAQLRRSGFILTRQWRENSRGLELVYWLCGDSGPVRVVVNQQEAVCFIETQCLEKTLTLMSKSRQWRHGETALKSFQHRPVTALYFNSQRALLDCRDRLERNNIDVFEADIKPVDRFLMERFVCGAADLTGDFTPQGRFERCDNPTLQASSFKPKFSTISIDIETDFQAKQLYSIGLYSGSVARVLMLDEHGLGGAGLAEKAQTRQSQSFQAAAERECLLSYYTSEQQLLTAFLDLIEELDPDILIGWNVVNFDLRVLQQCCDRAGIAFSLGRSRENIHWRRHRQTPSRHYALVPGRIVLDGIELMRSANYQFENFSLEFVSRQILQRGKLVEDVDQRGNEISELFKHNKLALAKYNLEDCRLVWDIFELEKLIAFSLQRSLLTGLELDRYGGSVAAFDFLYLPKLHRKGYVAPSLVKDSDGNISPGGYVMDSVPGIFDDVIVLDFKSLYPSIIRSFHIDPLGLITGLIQADAIEGFDGGKFSRETHILPQIIASIWNSRDEAKRDGNKVLSQAIKIIMNSFYGVLGTPSCRFFDSRLVSSITKRGHEIIIKSKQLIEAQGYQVIYGDTDSVFVLITPHEHKSVEQVGEHLATELNRWWTEHLQNKLQVSSCLEIQFETHFSKFLMPTIRGSQTGSKKRYAGLVRSSNEVGDAQQFELVFKGLEAVRSDWSPLARNFQQELYRLIFLDLPYADFVKQTVAQIRDESRQDELVFRQRLRRKLSDYVKNVPPHVQAARKAEQARADLGLPKLYHAPSSIEYVMTVNGAEPKQYLRSAIDYDFYIERQLAPVADAILVFKSSSMDELINAQIGLF